MQANLTITKADLAFCYPFLTPKDADATHAALQYACRILRADDYCDHWSDTVADALKEVNRILRYHRPGTVHGVEGISSRDGQASCHYLNTGDIYGTTILAMEEDEEVTICFGSYGDWVEQQEANGYTFD